MDPPLIRPEALVELDAPQADALLDRLEASVPVHPPMVPLALGGARRATVLGDTHGDWRSTLAATEAFLKAPGTEALVGLGDYIDRPPPDCPEGSVANALYLLQLAALFPDRVYLIQGNHETTRRIAVLPHTLPEEVDQLWGPEEARYLRILHLLERGPLAITTASGAYLAHGGFPLNAGAGAFPSEFSDLDDDGLAEVTWGEVSVGRIHRGFVPPFEEPQLAAFLHRSGTRVFLRGHDPDLTGRPIFHDRCLTLHTCRIYERFGGVVVARLPTEGPIDGLRQVLVEHLDTEGQGGPILDE